MAYDYNGDETQRCIINSFLIAQLLNQAENARILESLDATATNLVDLANTDISAMVYQKHEHAVKFVLRFAPISAASIVPTVNTSGEGYVLSEECRKEILDDFS